MSRCIKLSVNLHTMKKSFKINIVFHKVSTALEILPFSALLGIFESSSEMRTCAQIISLGSFHFKFNS